MKICAHSQTEEKQIKPLLALALQLKLENKSVISIKELCEVFGVKAP